MSFLRILSNAVLSALLFCFLLALLVADLNINMPFTAGVILILLGDLFVLYGIPAALVVVLISSAYRFISGRRGRLAFVAPPFLVLSTSLLVLAALIIMRENTAYFSAFFVPGIQAGLKAQMIALFVLAVTGLIVHFQYRYRRSHPPAIAAYFALMAGVLGFAVWQRVD
ncbi:MAG: hypothetical protein ABSA30_12035, partial [Candidatus Aminicenantales bacterium]